MGRYKTYLTKSKNLFIEIYLIGYNSEGESILFLVKTEEDIIFSGVIDCYEDNGINKTIYLIEKFNIKELDFLCWTHPDEDHSKGLNKILDKYTTKNTRIVIPESLLYFYKKLNEKTQLICNDIIDKVAKKKDEEMYDVICAQSGLPLINYQIKNNSRLRPYNFMITSISPFSDLLLSQYKNDKLKNNNFCIALQLEMEDINLLFTSDIERRTINRFSDNIQLPNNIHYIKIPHHGSDKSQLFLNFLQNIENDPIACTTVYANSHIPNFELLNQYKGICNKVFCTNSKIKTHINGKNGYGILATKIDVINKTVSCKCFYDAIEL